MAHTFPVQAQQRTDAKRMFGRLAASGGFSP
jgi:hypothetical protein